MANHGNRDRARQALVTAIAREVNHPAALEAIGKVPRELFLPPDERRHAYENRALPLARGQTVSQPLMVAVMTAALDPKPHERILEIGTGSGYQAAVLSHLAQEVVTIERLPELAGTAAVRLADLGYNNVHVHIARRDVLGWPDDAPYDGIIVTAGAPHIPESLVEELKIGGRLVVPVGGRGAQDMLVVTRTGSGTTIENKGGCRFVPLIGPDAWPDGTPEEDDSA